MNEKLAIVLEKLGAEGIDAFYVYLVLEYATFWLMIGLSVWGTRTVWEKVKDQI